MRYRITVLLSFLALILVLLTGWAAAQDQSKSNELTESSPLQSCYKRFDALDKKHVGKVTKDEFMASKHGSARAEKIFASKDLNHDGILTREEFCKGVGAGLEQNSSASPCKNRFKALDTDNNGVISKAEFMAAYKGRPNAEDLFKQKDTNGNGTLTPEEFCGAAGKEKPKSQ